MSKDEKPASTLYISYKKPCSTHSCGEYDFSDHQSTCSISNGTGSVSDDLFSRDEFTADDTG